LEISIDWNFKHLAKALSLQKCETATSIRFHFLRSQSSNRNEKSWHNAHSIRFLQTANELCNSTKNELVYPVLLFVGQNNFEVNFSMSQIWSKFFKVLYVCLLWSKSFHLCFCLWDKTALKWIFLSPRYEVNFSKCSMYVCYEASLSIRASVETCFFSANEAATLAKRPQCPIPASFDSTGKKTKGAGWGGGWKEARPPYQMYMIWSEFF
jgi:hypothetical protein